MSALKDYIVHHINEQNITISDLEKRAGLKTGAIRNIIYGRSKMPRLESLRAIAEGLGCTLDDLLGVSLEKKVAEANVISQSLCASSEIDSHLAGEFTWNPVLYLSALKYISEHGFSFANSISKQKLWSVVDEVYLYSCKEGVLDKRFADWVIEKVFRG